MKTYEILPTDKNLVQTLIDDTIGRDSDVFRFVNILNSIDCSYSVVWMAAGEVERLFS